MSILEFTHAPKKDAEADLRKEYEAARRVAIEHFLSDPATKDRISIAVQATLKAITDQNNNRKTVRVGQAAEIITSVVLDALSPTAADINLLAGDVAGNS